MDHIVINHQLIKNSEAAISVQDRGFRFGDGVFETCLINKGEIYNWQAHFLRLKAGLLAIKINFNDKNLLASCQELIKENRIKDGIIRIAISRGVGSIGYLPQKNIKPTLIIETSEKLAPPNQPIKLMASSYSKPSLKSLPVNFKLMNGINSTLVKMEAVENGCFDGIIFNEKNQICETSSANIFWIKGDVLFTPNLDCGCLAGTIRQRIIELSPIKIELVKAKIADLMEADEVFLTNVAIGVLKIDEIGGKKFNGEKFSKIFADLLKKDIQEYVN
ncbi:MAG: aminodeoxychorismate lyase [Rickettsiales bacterium]|jgi:aminodeoxychorismate lyase